MNSFMQCAVLAAGLALSVNASALTGKVLDAQSGKPIAGTIVTLDKQVVQTGLTELMNGRMAVVIAHRLSTVMRADQIWVIDGGRVLERGTHAELLAARGLYAKLSALQSA